MVSCDSDVFRQVFPIMNKQKLQEYKSRLQALVQELSTLDTQGDDTRRTVELDQSRVGRLSRMDALQGQAMSQETQRRRHKQLKDAKQALVRVEEGCYGECLECDELIAEARLQASPEAACCIACANMLESRGR